MKKIKLKLAIILIVATCIFGYISYKDNQFEQCMETYESRLGHDTATDYCSRR